MIITKVQLVHQSAAGKNLRAAFFSAKPCTMAVKAEGMIDTNLYGETFVSWLKETEMCLFRVESPLCVLRSQSTRTESVAKSDAKDAEPSQREQKAQKETNSKGIGTIIKYGQQFLLRHLSSEGLLTLNTMGTSSEPGTWEVLISQEPESHYVTKLSLSPNNQLQKPGESVKYGDKLNIEFTSDNQQYLLHTNKTARDGLYEVNASHVRSNWEFQRYEVFSPNTEAIKAGVPVSLSIGRRKMRLTEGVGKGLPTRMSMLFGKGKSEPESASAPTVVEPQSAPVESSKPAPKSAWGILKKPPPVEQKPIEEPKSAESAPSPWNLFGKKVEVCTPVSQSPGPSLLPQLPTRTQESVRLPSPRRARTEGPSVSHSIFSKLVAPPPASSNLLKRLQLTTEENNFGTLWILEKVKPMEGGALAWEDRFYMKNVQSGRYVANEDLEMKEEPNPDFAFYIVKPDSFRDSGHIPVSYPVIIKSTSELFLTPEKVLAEEEFMGDVVPANARFDSSSVAYETNLLLTKDQDAEAPLEVSEVLERDYLFFVRVTKLVPKVREFRMIISDWIDQRSVLSHLDFYEREERTKKVSENFCKSLNRLEAMVSEAKTPEINAKRRCIIVGLGLASQLIEMAGLLEEYARLSLTLPEDERNSMAPVAAKMETKIWTFVKLLVEDLEFCCENLARHDEMMLNLLPTRKALIGPVITEIYRVLDPEIRDVRGFFQSWVQRLDTVTAANVIDQSIFFQLIKNVCEVDDNAKPEYQRAVISLLYEEKRFFLLRLVKESTYYIHFFPQSKTPEEFLALNPDLAPYAEYSDAGLLIFPLNAMSQLPEYVAYIQEALGLINVLCKGKVAAAREVVTQVQGIEAEDIISLFEERGVHMSILQSLTDLIQALLVTTPPLVSFKETEAENYCYEEESSASLELIDSGTDLVYHAGTDPRIVRLIKATLQFWLCTERPAALRQFAEAELLAPVGSILRLTYSLMDFNHTTSLFTKLIAVVLSYLLAGFSGERGKKFGERHWTVDFVHQLLANDDSTSGEVNSNIMDFFKQVVETLDLIQLKLKRNKLNSVVSFFEGLQGRDLDPQAEDLRQFSDALKSYSSLEVTRIDEVKEFLCGNSPSSPDFDLRLMRHPPRLPDYLLYAILNLNSVHQGLKEAVIRTLSSCFNEELFFIKDVKSIDLIRGEGSIRSRLTELKQDLEPVDILTKAKLELNEHKVLRTLVFIRSVLFELISLMRPNGAEPITYIQNMLRNLGFHRTLTQLWPLMGRLDSEQGLKEEDRLLAFEFKALLVSFFAYFVKGNLLNQKALKRVLQKKHFVMDFPEYAELIFELTHYRHIPQTRLQKLISGFVERCAVYADLRELNSYHFLRLMMLGPTLKEEPAMQNIIARHIAESYKEMPEFSFDSITYFKDAVFVELLSLAAISNASITLMCRGIIPFARLVALISSHKEPEVLSSLLLFLLYVYMLPGDQESVKQVHPASVVKLVAQKLMSILSPLMTDSSHLLSVASKNIYELAFTDNQWPLVAVNVARTPFEESRCVWRLLCAGTGDDARQGGFLAVFPRLLKYADEPDKLVQEAKAALLSVSQLKSIAENCKSQGVNASGLLRAITTFEGDVQRAIPEVGDEGKKKMGGLTAFFEAKKPVSGSAGGGSSNLKFAEFVKALTAVYLGQRRLKSYDFAKPIARRFLRFTGFRKFKSRIRKEDIAMLTKNLLRLRRLFTQTDHRKAYFTILTHIVPDEPEVKVKLNPCYMQSDVINEAIDELLQGSMGNVNAALLFLNKLLDEQARSFQSHFQSLVDRSERSYHLFYKIKEELDAAKSLTLSKVAQEELSSGFSAIRRKDSALTEREVFLVRSLKFLQLCCDNCNIDFQNYIRKQGNQIGKADVDLVSEVAQFLIDIQDKSRLLIREPGTGKIIIKALAALLDFVTGPCPENQERLGNNVLLLQAVNSFVKVTQMEQDEISIGIHNKIMIFLLTLLEGNPSPTVPQTMIKFIDLRLFREGVERIYTDLIKSREEEIYRESFPPGDNRLHKVKSAVLQAIFLIKLKKHFNNQELKKFMSDSSPAYEFYTSNIGYAQVERDGAIEEIYFPVPFMCKFLTPASRQTVILDVNRSSHQSKVEDFISKVDYYHTEMKHQQHLSQHQWLKFTSKLWKLYAQLSYLVVLSINLLLLGTLQGSEEKSTETYSWLWLVLLSLGLMQLLLYIAYFVFNMIEYLPLRLQNVGSYESLEIERYPSFPHNESYLLTDIYWALEFASHDTTSFRNSLRDITENLDFYYNFIYLLVAVLGLYEPLIYPVLMLDIVKQNQELVNILKSITVNLRQLLLTLVLGLIIIFLFSVHSFSHFQEYYNPENNADCSTLYNCFTSTLYFGIRAGGGIGDGLDPATSEDYWSRMAFDLLYYVIMIIILLNIIFGIIIDTFAQLRDERSEMMNDLTNTCFVCGMSRSQIELKGKGWSHHFMCEHSPLSYLAFFVYLKETNIVDCSGIEKYVKEKMDDKDSSFMPTTSRLLQKKATS